MTICCQVHHDNLINFYGYTTHPHMRICMEYVVGGALDVALYRSTRSGRRWWPTYEQVRRLVGSTTCRAVAMRPIYHP